MSLTDALLERTSVYRLWQAPFADQKFAPVLAQNNLQQVRRVLDVACGPGTNTRYFERCDYLGIDLNPRYIEHAKARYRRQFLVADACQYRVPPSERFDFILVNSFLHHLPDSDVADILSHLATLLTSDGHIHLLELVMPPNASPARWLARHDRGKHARPLHEWEQIFAAIFHPVVAQPYPLTGFGVTLWNMFYFKGKIRQAKPSSTGMM